ncbi:MAG TPA: FKBP-type peptidyl-prolyl cis-trans isomerase [Fimbriimonas sp.]
MNLFAFAALLIPVFDASELPGSILGESTVLLSESQGSGKAVDPDDLVTLSFEVNLLDGRAIFDTDRRGLPYRFRLGKTDTTLTACLGGMRTGGVRTVYTQAAGKGVASVPEGTPLILRLSLLDAGR